MALSRRVLREEIRDRLMDDILKHRLAPGDRIVETRVAREFGVSQAPVREALRDLELFGFVVSSPFRGAQVREISTDDLVQLFPIRAVLEGLAAHDLASAVTASTLAQLEALLESMRAAAAQENHSGVLENDIGFHFTIVEACGNRLLRQLWERLRMATTTFLTVSMGYCPLPELAERHVPVLDALRARDPGAAERAMREHIEKPGQWIRLAMQDSDAQKRGGQRPARRRRKAAS